jgi:tetratricopeptide (TPR) repeat protein
MSRLLTFTLAVIVVVAAGCGPAADPGHTTVQSNNQSKDAKPAVSPAALALDPCALALAPHTGATKVDREIIRLQQAISSASNPVPLLERLGWMFVSKARASFDPGFYKLAEQCALCVDVKQPGAVEVLLLRGHVLQNLHRFKEAEPLARKLVEQRALSFDFGLLGDVLMEQGKLKDAIAAYQKMVDLKPEPQAYARIAHVRWLKGDLEGALEMMRDAAHGASPSDAESAAWFYTRLASYELQAGHWPQARNVCAAVLDFQKDYPPALLLSGRMALAENKGAEAIEPLLRAAKANPLPEYQWTLAEALRATGRVDDAKRVEAELMKSGAANDPRTFALFLATRREHITTAIELAQRELSERADVHTHDALAWALAAANRWEDARQHSEKALAEGTADARLYLHAGIIAAHLSQPAEAGRWLDRAVGIEQMLLPSEREQLKLAREQLASVRASAAGPISK